MTIEEAVEIINEMTPCASCQYRNTGCKRKDKHVWSDGFCHTVDEAIELIKITIYGDPSGCIEDEIDECLEDEPNTCSDYEDCSTDECLDDEWFNGEGTELDDGNDEGDEEP